MKTLHTVLVVLICISSLFAQRNRGNTYALIVGISDYNDEKIPDLNYAHVDAAAFAEYLRSPAGGNVPDQNITLLTDSLATNGTISDALFNIGKKVTAKDRVFFYFAGHGDVENDTIYNLGFLLAWDTPYNCYRNNALSLEELNREAARMSINKNAEVIYILDACHSGELAGEANEGRRLASDQMKKRNAREVRIMSCESDQLSLEHAQIGGGRGIFSYHLIRGLTGLAQKEGSDNLKVTVKDLRNFLEEKVPDHAEAFNHVQSPLIKGGNRKFRLAYVNEEALANLLDESLPASDAIIAAVDINTRGIRSTVEDISLHNRNFINAIKDSKLYLHPDFPEKLDLNPKDFYKFTLKQLEEETYNKKLSPTQLSALKYFQNTGRKKIKDSEWQENMSHQMAIALNDLAQQAINSYLQADAKEMERRNITNTGQELEIYPILMNKALDLLDSEHPLYKSLKIKYHYFNGVVKRLQMIKENSPEAQKAILKDAMIEQQKALALDDKAPYVFNEIGILNSLNQDKKAAEKHYLHAIELAPTWAIPYSNLSGIYNGFNELDQAKIYADSAIALNPLYPMTYSNLGKNYRLRNNYIKAESNFRTAMKLAPYNYVPYDQLAYLYLATNEYGLAEEFFIESEKRKGIYVEILRPNRIADYSDKEAYNPPGFDHDSGGVITFSDCYATLNPQLDSLLEINPKNIEAYFQYALFQEEQGCRKAAVYYYKKVLELDDKHLDANMALALYYYDTKDYEDAAIIYKKVTTFDSKNILALKNLADILHYKLDNTDESIPYYYRAIVLERENVAINKTLANIFFSKKQHETAAIFYLELLNSSNLDEYTYLEMANNFMQWGHEADAEDHYKRLAYSLSLDDKSISITAQDSLLSIFMRQQRYKEAESIVIKIKPTYQLNNFYTDRVNQFPDDLNWFYSLTQLGFKNKFANTKTSIERYKSLINLKPDHESLTDMYVNLGTLNYNIGRYQTSAQYYELAIARDTSNANTYLTIADAYLKVFEKEKAYIYLEQMHDRQMIDIDNRLVFAKMLTLAGRYDDAQKVIDVADEIYPFESSEIYKKRANLYMISQDIEKAILANKKLIEMNEHLSYSAYNLASIYAVNEEYDVALNFLEKAFDSGFDYPLVLKYDPVISMLKKNRTAQFDALLATQTLRSQTAPSIDSRGIRLDDDD